MEYLDIVDENGIPTGKVVDREKAHREGILHHTAHVWVVRCRQGKVQILLQRRSENKDSFPGCYDISSAGHIPAGEDYAESAIRELKEELGICVKSEELIDCGFNRTSFENNFHGKTFRNSEISKIFLLWKDMDESDFTVQREEVDLVLWVDFDSCIDMIRENTIPNCIDIKELEMLWERIKERQTKKGKKYDF